MKPSLLWLVLLSSGPLVTLPAQDDRLLAAFDRAFTPPPRGKATHAERLQALEAVAGIDGPRAAEILVEGWGNVATELAAIDAQRDAMNQEMVQLLAGQEFSPQRTLPKEQNDRFKQLQREIGPLRTRSDELREQQARVGERVAALRARDSALFLLQRVCGSKKHALPLRLAAARAVGAAAADVMPELAAALPRSKEPPEQIVLLDAMALAGRTAQLHAGAILPLLLSREEAVAERAALALAKIAVPDAIEPMIQLLARSKGQTRPRIAAALEVLTGEQFGDNSGAWQAWWRQDGPAFLQSGRPLGTGVPSHRKATDKFYYFGIPQDACESLLYVIDCSGSMKEPIESKDADGKVTKTSRIEACKAELVRALGLLKPEQKFGILWYNDLPHFWEPKLQPATKEAVARAQAFVRTLQPASSTNIHDSLERCFSLVGRGARDKYYGVELDTIFLLTDGSPTKPDGTADSTDKILLGVRSWNPLQRVTIHCIALGKDLNERFLRQLASENGGEFKQF